MRNSGDVGQTTENLGHIGVCFKSYQQSSRDPADLSATAVRQRHPKVLAKPFFEEVTVTFLESKFVIMNDEKSIHISIIMGCLRLGEQ